MRVYGAGGRSMVFRNRAVRRSGRMKKPSHSSTTTNTSVTTRRLSSLAILSPKARRRAVTSSVFVGRADDRGGKDTITPFRSPARTRRVDVEVGERICQAATFERRSA